MFKTINILVNIFIYVHFVSVCLDIKQKKHFIFFKKGSNKVNTKNQQRDATMNEI